MWRKLAAPVHCSVTKRLLHTKRGVGEWCNHALRECRVQRLGGASVTKSGGQPGFTGQQASLSLSLIHPDIVLCEIWNKLRQVLKFNDETTIKYMHALVVYFNRVLTNKLYVGCRKCWLSVANPAGAGFIIPVLRWQLGQRLTGVYIILCRFSLLNSLVFTSVETHHDRG